MSYVIAGRTIKNEYLAIGTILTTIGAAVASSSGKKDAPKPIDQGAKVEAGSSEEADFIRQFVAAAEKEGSGAAGH